MTPSQAVAKAAEILGGQAEMARRIGVKPPTISQWIAGSRPVPAVRALDIESLTGGAVRRNELSPTFPWEKIGA